MLDGSRPAVSTTSVSSGTWALWHGLVESISNPLDQGTGIAAIVHLHKLRTYTFGSSVQQPGGDAGMSDSWKPDERAAAGGRYGAEGHVDPQGGPPTDDGTAPASVNRPSRSAVTLLVVAGISSMVGCFLAIPGAILGIFAVVHQADRVRSAKFTRWGWTAYVIGATLTAIAGIALMGIAMYAETGND
jgi:hypothetical protein